MKFTGSNVLVTGASRGIGAQIAKTLASFGLKVWINYRSGAEAAEPTEPREREGAFAERRAEQECDGDRVAMVW